jgi:antitoxin MazE
MKTRLSLWGNSLAVRIPKPVAAAAKLKAGDEVELEVEGPGRVALYKPASRPTLQELVNRIKAENMHKELDLNEPRGNEVG